MADKLSYYRPAPAMGTTTHPNEFHVCYGPMGECDPISEALDPEVGHLESYTERYDVGRKERTKRLWRYFEYLQTPTADRAELYLKGREPLSPGESEDMAFLSLRDIRKWLEDRVAGRDEPFPTYLEWLRGPKSNPEPESEREPNPASPHDASLLSRLKF